MESWSLDIRRYVGERLGTVKQGGQADGRTGGTS
jgi:hypothetical protein